MEEFNEQANEQAKRPTFLKVLCILSFISLGMGAISAVFSVLSGPQSDEQIVDMQVQMAQTKESYIEMGAEDWVPLIDQMEAMMIDTNDHHMLATLINIFVIALGIFAVIRMWQGQRLGFHLYIGYSLLGVFASYIYIPAAHLPIFFPIFSGVISALFIFLYSRNLKWMR